MGNCCKGASSMEWDGEDWGCLTSKQKGMKSSRKVFDEVHGHGHGLNLGNVEKERLLGSLRASSDANGKVKIMISKKELAELLGGRGTVNHATAAAEQVLVRLINARDHVNDHHHTHHKPWRPVLQSIPEVD